MMRSSIPCGLMAAIVLVFPGSSRADEDIYDKVVDGTVFVWAPREHFGSGALVDQKRKWVVTNYHVVEDIADVWVFFPVRDQDRIITDSSHYLKNFTREGIRGRVIARDTGKDLALIQLASLPGKAQAIPLAAKSASPGQTIHSIGNPSISEALWVYNAGKVRQVFFKKWVSAGHGKNFDFAAQVVLMQSPINPGDSGGPVVNNKAELIGVVSSTFKDAQLVSLCIDLAEVRSLLTGAQAGKNTAAQDDKVVHSLAPEKMEEMFKGMGVTFKKSEGKEKTAGTVYYDFSRDNKNMRLYLFSGKDIMLDLVYQKYPLETLNQWNARAKFSRATLHKDSQGEFTALEANLDILGGVTPGTIRHFFNTFYDEVRAFDKFVSGGVARVVPPAGGNDKIFTSLSSEKLESILKELNLTYKKQSVKGGNTIYDYESKNFKIRLANFGGKDLMLDAMFKKLPLDKVNQYNFDRKFIRTVFYAQGGQEYTALEANLDCSAGTSENMIRHFLLTFDDEVQAFANFVGKN